MKKTAVFMSLILIFNLLLFVPVSADQQIIAEHSVAAGYNHVLGLNQYGRVFSAGDNTYGQCLTYNWIDITQIVAGKYFSAGLCKDGTVTIAGKYRKGNDFLEFDVSGLERIVQISAGDNFLAALNEDGNVFIVGNDDNGNINTESWSDITKIACGIDHVVGSRADGTCVGAGRGGEADVNNFSDITDIYAGAHLTVLKDVNETFFHAGSTIDVVEYEEFDEYWDSRDWTDINDVIIFPDSSNNGIVVAIKNDGTIIVDNNDLINSEQLTAIKGMAIKRDNNKMYAVCLSLENNISTLGRLSDGEEEHMEYLDQISEFDLEMKPLEDVYIKNPQVVVANNTVAFVLPNGQVKSIGKKDLFNLEGIKQLSADIGFNENDVFIGVDNEGNAISSMENDTWIDDWMGILKAAPTICNKSQRIAVALRWDKRMICYYRSSSTAPEQEYVIKKDNVVDVVCGNYFIAYLTEDGKTEVKEIGTSVSTRNDFEVEKMKNITRLVGGFNHIVGLKGDGTCVATGGSTTGGAAECEVSEWNNIVEVVAGDKFTVGLRNDGTCEFTGYNSQNNQNKLKNAILKTDEEDMEYWENISQIYSSKNTVVAHKNDGFFEYATWSSEDLSQLKNTYYKDNTFYTFKVEENIAKVEYYSDEDIEVYFSYFDEEGRPIGFEKEVLPSVDSLTKVEFENEKSHSFTISVGEPTADKMKFYMEQEAVGDTVKITHCAQEGQRIMLAFYDDEDNMLDIKVRTLGEINNMTETSFSCANATKYKLFIRDGALPLYKAEGTLN